MSEPPSPADFARDDIVAPFQVEGVDVRGRLARLGPSIDRILAAHAYPGPVAQALGEAVTLAALIGASIKLRGRLTVQAKGDGPVATLVADCDREGRLRGYASFDAEAVAARAGEAPFALIGRGHLAISIDQGPDTEIYQGLAALEGDSLAACAEGYFARSEQIRTAIRLAVGENVSGAGSAWRAGGLMAQHLPKAGVQPIDFAPDGASGGTSPWGEDEAPDGWRRARLLIETLEPHELIDPLLTPDRVLYRLFHEDGVRAFGPQDVGFGCPCTAARVRAVLRTFSPAERADLVEAGAIRATCEFCAAEYRFDPETLEDAPAA